MLLAGPPLVVAPGRLKRRRWRGSKTLLPCPTHQLSIRSDVTDRGSAMALVSASYTCAYLIGSVAGGPVVSRVRPSDRFPDRRATRVWRRPDAPSISGITRSLGTGYPGTGGRR